MKTHKKRRKLRKTRKKGSGHTSLDPEFLTGNPPSKLEREPGSTADLADKALKEQAERRRVKAEAAKAEAAKAEAEEPPERSRKSSESSASDPIEFHDPLQKLRGQKSEPSANFKGTVGENPDPKISFFGVQRHTKGARRSRKNKKRKTRRRR